MMARVLARLHREGQSWLAHAAIAGAFTVVADPFLGPWESWRLAVWGYAFRELDRLVREWLKFWRAAKWGGVKVASASTRLYRWPRFMWATRRWRHEVNWLGSIGDVAVPALAAALVTLRWLL